MTVKSTTLGLVLALAHLPLLIIFLHGYLWPQPHYQFFPIAIAGVAYLIWQRWPSERQTPPLQGSRIETLSLVSGVAILAAAVALWYAPLAGVAAIITSGGLLLYFAGRQSLRTLLPAWAVLWLIIPPPPPWDVQFVQKMQQAAARASSLILDVFGIRHLMEGTVLEFPGRRLLVEEACSGVQSLFALLACTALYLVWVRRPAIPTILLLIAAVFWSGVGNIGRVVTIAVGQALFGVDLSTGWAHQLLGFVMFGIALGMLASTDALLTFLLAPVYGSPQEPNRNPLSRLWNRVVAGGAQRSAESDQWGEPVEAGESMEASIEETAANQQPDAASASPSEEGEGEPHFRKPLLAASGPFGWLVLTGFAGCLAALQLVILLAVAFKAGEQDVPQTRTALVQRISNAVGAELLPQDSDGWRRVEYETTQREVDSIFGEYSNMWFYECPEYKALVSLDYPFTGWHDLRVCYHNTGWRIVHDREGAADASTSSNRVGPYWEIGMRKPTGEYAYLWFSLLDQSGQAIAPWSIANRVAPRFKKHPVKYLLGGEALAMLDAASYQTQVLVTSNEALSREEQERVRDRFFDFRHLIGRLLADAATRRAAPSAGSD